MPLYSYKCTACGRVHRSIRSIENRNQPMYCAVSHSHTPCVKVLEAPYVQTDFTPYNCPITGDLISGRRAHEENLAKHGCRVLEPGETQQRLAANRAEDEKLDATIEASVDEAITLLPSDKRERLGAEMENGVDVEVTRCAGKAPNEPRI